MKDSPSLTDYEAELLATIETYGCQVITVFDPDGNEPTFSYSIGFSETVQQPEVIIFGLDGTLMHSMINETLSQCREGLKLKDGVSIDGLLSGFSCVARKVHASWIVPDYFNSAIWYHKREFGHELADAMQIIWPGAVDGLYPWDIDSDPYVQGLQPALYQPRFDA